MSATHTPWAAMKPYLVVIGTSEAVRLFYEVTAPDCYAAIAQNVCMVREGEKLSIRLIDRLDAQRRELFDKITLETDE